MLNDFSKLETFLMVVKEKSFSKASKKLGISQPAVTQQIRYIEDYLDTQIVNRKKTGIKLTKEGILLHNLATKIEKCLISCQKDLDKIMKKDVTFTFGTSFIIGNYILPKFLNNLKNSTTEDVHINVSVSNEAINDLLDKKINIALVESYEPNNELIFKEWLEDEVVIFSNQKLPSNLTAEDLLSYNWVCRNPDSPIRFLFKESLDKINYPDCDTFNITNEITSDTTIVQTVLHSDKNMTPTVSIVSKMAIDSLLKSGALFESRLNSYTMTRKLYIAYRKDEEKEQLIKNMSKNLLKIKK